MMGKETEAGNKVLALQQSNFYNSLHRHTRILFMTVIRQIMTAAPSSPLRRKPARKKE